MSLNPVRFLIHSNDFLSLSRISNILLFWTIYILELSMPIKSIPSDDRTFIFCYNWFLDPFSLALCLVQLALLANSVSSLAMTATSFAYLKWFIHFPNMSMLFVCHSRLLKTYIVIPGWIVWVIDMQSACCTPLSILNFSVVIYLYFSCNFFVYVFYKLYIAGVYSAQVHYCQCVWKFPGVERLFIIRKGYD